MGVSTNSIFDYISDQIFPTYDTISISSDWTKDEKTPSDPIINLNNNLRAELVCIDDYPTARKVISAWASIAKEKANNPLATDSEKDQFSGCEWISKAVASCLSDSDDESLIYVCKDKEGNIQGAMVVDVLWSHVDIDYLVTNPINIRSIVNEHESKKVAGAGTCLLQKAEEVAVESGKKSIKLYPLTSAINFYLKNGFSYINYCMVKTVHKIHDSITVPYFDVA